MSRGSLQGRQTMSSADKPSAQPYTMVGSIGYARQASVKAAFGTELYSSVIWLCPECFWTCCRSAQHALA